MDSRLEEMKEMELRFRNKIIELEKELEYEALRANEYQSKFRQAVMENSSKLGDQQLLLKLNKKQTQVNGLRKQLFESNRRHNDSSHEQSDQLVKQNQQLRKVVEQLKNAAVAAIMEKDSEIDEMKRRISELDTLSHITALQQKNVQLENNLKLKVAQHEQQIRKLSQKLAGERDDFSNKIFQLQREFSNQQNQKQKLLQKAQSLQGNIENLQKTVVTYESKVYEIQNIRSSQKMSSTKNQYELQKQIDILLEEIKAFEQNEKEFNKKIQNLTKMSEEHQKIITELNQQKEELDRKLKIKQRKTNTKQSSKSIYDSFEGFSKKADIYSSFAKKQPHNPVLESFIGQPVKLSDIAQIEIEEIENFSGYIHDVNEITQRRKQSQNLQQIIKDAELKLQPPIQSKANTPLEFKNERAQELEKQVSSLLQEIQNFNSVISNLTNELQQERQDKLQLKKKHSLVESEFKVERESSRLHIYKLENALLIEKLQNAEKLQSNKEIREHQKKYFQEQIRKLKVEIENSKKKKGFFK